MFRTMLRFLGSRLALMIGVPMVLAGWWMVWWAWPERPLRELRLVGQSLGNTRLAPDGASLFTTVFTETPEGKRTERSGVLNLIDGQFHFPSLDDRNVTSRHVTPHYLAGGRLLMLSWGTGLLLIDSSSGAVLWEAANLGYHRSWTDDGRLVVAESRADAAKMDRTVLFDTTKKTVKELPQGAGPYGFDKSGQKMLTRVEAAPAVFAIWNTTTKTEIARYQDARYQSIYGAAINPAGTQVVVVAKVPNEPDEERRGGFLWNLDNSRVDLLELPVRTKDFVSGRLEFTRDGQNIVGPDSYPRWEIKPTSTRMVEPTRQLISRAFPVAQRYLAARNPNPLKTSSLCTMFDDETNLPIASVDWHMGNSAAISSPDSRWMLIENFYIPNWFTKYLNTLLRSLRRDTMSSKQFDVVSMETGRVRNRIPFVETDLSRSYFIGFTQHDRLWTQRIDDLVGTRQSASVLQEWSCYAAYPPWWLWLLTVGGVAVMVWNVRRRARCVISNANESRS